MLFKIKTRILVAITTVSTVAPAVLATVAEAGYRGPG
jgi:hypothetical protein